jgi:hypothetical protein
MRCRTVHLAALSALGLGLLNPVTAPASAADGLVDSSQLTTVAVADGIVRDRSGVPARGVGVTLYAWPSNDALESARQGDSFPLTPVAKARTDASGAFVLRIADLARLRPLASRYGIVNFDLVASTPTDFDSFSFGRRVLQNPTQWVLGVAEHAPVGGEGVQAPSAHASLQLQRVSAPIAASSTSGVCTATLVTDYGVRQAIVGQTTSATTLVDHDFVYAQGATSSQGVGVSADGRFGSFSASGTTAKSATSEWTFATQGDNKSTRYISGWRFGKYYMHMCGTSGARWYEARTTSFAGGTWYAQTGLPGMAKCVPFGPRAHFNKTSNAAYNFTTGYAVSAAIGIDLSTQTGYSTTAKVHYFNRSTTVTRQLCGNNDFPSGNTSFVVAKA